jgi:hypothetical protein
MASDVPPHPPPAVPIDAAAAAVPAIDLGPGFEPIAFTPGRFAVAIQATRRGTHARNRFVESSTMSLVLDLTAGGDATACRGWTYTSSNDGPKVSTEDRFREQRGFRGRFTVRDGVVEAELDADDTGCPPIGEYLKGVPRRASTMTLRCVAAQARGSTLDQPVLLCQWLDASTPEVERLHVDEVAPSPWILLGSGPGVRITITGAPPSMIGEPRKVTVEPAPAPIDAGAWQHPF